MYKENTNEDANLYLGRFCMKFVLKNMFDLDEETYIFEIGIVNHSQIPIDIMHIQEIIEGIYLKINDGTEISVDYGIADDKVRLKIDKLFITESSLNPLFSFGIVINLRMQTILYSHVVLSELEKDVIRLFVDGNDYYFVRKDFCEFCFRREPAGVTERIALVQIIREKDVLFWKFKSYLQEENENNNSFFLKARVRKGKKELLLCDEPITLQEGQALVPVSNIVWKTLGDSINKYREIWDVFLENMDGKKCPFMFESNNEMILMDDKEYSNLHIYRNKYNETSVRMRKGICIVLQNIKDNGNETVMEGSISKKVFLRYKLKEITLIAVKTGLELTFPFQIIEEREHSVLFEIRMAFSEQVRELTYGTYEFCTWVDEEHEPVKLLLNVYYTQFSREFLLHKSLVLVANQIHSIAYYTETGNNLRCSIQPEKISGMISKVWEIEEGICVSGCVCPPFPVSHVEGAYIFSEIECKPINIKAEISSGKINYQLFFPYAFAQELQSVVYDCKIITDVGEILLCDTRFIEKAMWKGRCNRLYPVYQEGILFREYQVGYYEGIFKFRSLKRLNFKLFHIKMKRRGFGLHVKHEYELPKQIKFRLFNELTGEKREVSGEVFKEELVCRLSRKVLKGLGAGIWTLQVVYGKNEIVVCSEVNRDRELVIYSPNRLPNYMVKISEKKRAVISEKDKNIVVEVRELYPYEKGIERRRNRLAVRVAKKLQCFVKAPIWLLGENLAEVAQDNGLAFFKYCCEKKIPETVYYVTKKTNQNMADLKPYNKRLVYYDSFKHLVLYYLSEFLIVSHGIRDVMPSIYHNVIYKNEKEVIYLQHGIIAMKRIYFNPDSYNGMIRKFVVSSKQEKEICCKFLGLPSKVVCSTGLARFDYLKMKGGGVNSILVMPTWREWILYSKDNFGKSQFYQYYSALLSNPELLAYLAEHHIKLYFYPHVEIIKNYLYLFEHFQNNSVEIVVPSKKSVVDAIAEADILITDYSSVAFDCLKRGAPVIFYQFDYYEYMNHRGAYIPFSRQLPGPICRNLEELKTEVTRYVENSGEILPEYRERLKAFWDYNDRENGQRIYNMILSARRAKKGEKI